MKYFTAIISDKANGYTYNTALTKTANRAQSLAVTFINRKNLDFCEISVVPVEKL